MVLFKITALFFLLLFLFGTKMDFLLPCHTLSYHVVPCASLRCALTFSVQYAEQNAEQNADCRSIILASLHCNEAGLCMILSSTASYTVPYSIQHSIQHSVQRKASLFGKSK